MSKHDFPIAFPFVMLSQFHHGIVSKTRNKYFSKLFSAELKRFGSFFHRVDSTWIYHIFIKNNVPKDAQRFGFIRLVEKRNIRWH